MSTHMPATPAQHSQPVAGDQRTVLPGESAVSSEEDTTAARPDPFRYNIEYGHRDQPETD